MILRICESDEDMKELAACAKDIWNEYFVTILAQEQIDYMVDKFQSYPVLKKAIQEEGYTYYLAYDHQRLVGFCGIRVDDSRLFLSKLYVRKEMRGQKLSSLLLNTAIEFAKLHKLTAIYLTCNKYNTHSLEVYKHKGFQMMDAAQTDIGNGFIMDDYILQLNL